MKYKLWFALGWLAVSAGLVLAVFWITAQLGDRFHHDFRGQPMPGKLRPFGPQAGLYVKKEPDGLRISLPKDRKEHEPVGVMLNLPVEGDFEVTTTVEIVQAEVPSATSFGVGVLMTADENARLGRLDRANGKQVLIWDQWLFDDPKNPKLVGGTTACDAKIVQLRMKRTGNTLAYLWAPDGEKEFQLIHEEGFRTDEVKVIKVMAESGSEPRALDVRFLDLRVTGDPGTAPLFWWLGTAAVILGGGALGLIFVPALKPRAAKANEPAVVSEVPEETIVAACPGCKKTLRIPARTAGKKIKCPGCETAFTV